MPDDAVDDSVEEDAVLLHLLQSPPQIGFLFHGRGGCIAALEDANGDVRRRDRVGDGRKARARFEWIRLDGSQPLHAEKFTDVVVGADFEVAKLFNVTPERPNAEMTLKTVDRF